MCKKFDEWNQKKKMLETYKTEKIAKNIQEGAIYWVSIGVNVGNEMRYYVADDTNLKIAKFLLRLFEKIA